MASHQQSSGDIGGVALDSAGFPVKVASHLFDLSAVDMD